MFTYLHRRYKQVPHSVTGCSQIILLMSLQIGELKDSYQADSSLTGCPELTFVSEHLVPELGK